MPFFSRFYWGCVLLLALAGLSGCSAGHYRESADREVYRIIEAKSGKIGGMPSAFSIDEATGTSEALRPAATEPASATRVLSLREAVEWAVENSREYQRRKESLYTQGLSLTLSRHRFDPLFSGSFSGDITSRETEDTVSGGLSLGVRKMLATGGDISISLVNNLFRVISGGDPNQAAASAVAAAVSQPLLQGAGRKIALEELTQAERDMVYAIREFVRYRKSFSVGIAKNYFNLLRLQDRLTNSLNNYENLRDERIRAEFMARAGRTPEFQVDQQRQSELSARDSWIRSAQTYSNALDQFKLDLGLPTEILLEPDPRELKSLSVDIDRESLDLERAIAAALGGRLDFMTVQDRWTDAERKVEVATDRLKPRLDVGGSYSRSTPGTQPLNFRDGEDVFRGQADLELPLDRKSERNSYRQSLIQLASARRSVVEQEDRIRLEVRNAFRNLDQAEESYRIQMNSLRLAERRVESTSLLQQAGRANTRDVLEAREALLNAQNNVTQAVVDHFNTRLDLSLAMETLRVDDRGFWVGTSLAGAGQGGDREN